jgi:hypothetical protein
MKKLLVTLLALTVVGIFAFADDAAPAPVAKIGAWTANGIQLYNSGNGQKDDAYWNGNQYQWLGVSYSSDLAGWSVDFDGTWFTSPRSYTGWVKPFGNIVTIKAGKLREGGYNTWSYIEGNNFATRIANAEKGLMLDFAPISGLNFALVDKVGDTTAAFSSSSFAVGAEYALPDLATIDAQYNGSAKEIYAGADVKAIKGVAAKAGVNYNTGTSTTKVLVSGGTKVLDSKLDVGLDTSVALATATTVAIEAQGAYALSDKVTVALKGGSSDTFKTFWADPYVTFGAGAGTLRVDFNWTSNGTWYIPVCVIVGF